MQDKNNIIELLARSRQEAPDRPYVGDATQSLTYDAFWARMERLAARFAHEAKPESRLLIVSSNSVEYILGYFATLYARQVTVEVSPHESHEALREIAAEVEPWAILTDQAGLAEALGLRHVDVGAESENAGPLLDLHTQVAASKPSDLASIVYTSGTTGRSKGVMLSHGNFLAVTEAIVDYLRLTYDDRYLLALPLFHTYGKSVLLTTTLVGGSIHLFEDFPNLPVFLRTLKENRITVFSGVPFHINMLLRRGNLKEADLPELRRVTVSGAALAPDRITEFRALIPSVRFFFMYGLTESSTRAFYLPPEDIERKRGSVGVPIRGVRAAIRDETGRDLPAGREGDIYLTGPNVMLGYFKAPDLTAHALRDGWLWTGDVGYLDPDGYLFITGRKKDIINCAGERISAREIEETLERHANVAEAAVVGTPDALLGESIHAFVVEKEPRGDEADLRAWCNDRLSHLKVPRSYRFVDSLPRTASGKVKKHLLAEALQLPR
jgi:acyl-CoA synthetase (AMP-forming)/AMP-acid ligase II